MEEIDSQDRSTTSVLCPRRYGKQKTIKAVNDVDLAIRENEIYGIAGESGCGKTTLLKTLGCSH